jgi:prolipoprotein diacylglyceryltransferase
MLKTKPASFQEVFFIMVFTARFLIEFVKEDQEAFEAGMTFNMGQWLSIPFIFGGIVLIFMAQKGMLNKKITTTTAKK